MYGAIWIPIILFIIIFCICRFKLKCCDDDAISLGIGSTFFSLFICIFILIIFTKYDKKIIVKQKEYPILSLKDIGSPSLSGSFFLGSGTINSNWYYVSYINTADGIFRKRFNQNITYINEIDNVKPKAEEYVEEIHQNKNSIAKFLGSSENKVRRRDYVSKYILYVPKGTIIKNFHLK